MEAPDRYTRVHTKTVARARFWLSLYGMLNEKSAWGDGVFPIPTGTDAGKQGTLQESR